MPEYNGKGGMLQLLAKNLRYPETAREEGFGGRVTLKFVVQPDGSVTDVVVVKGVHPDIDSEAVRVVRLSSGHWIPGTRNGVPVPVFFTLPITFHIDEDSPRDPRLEAAMEAYTQHRYSDAIAPLEKAYLRDPGKPMILDYLLKANFLAGKQKNACNDLETAMSNPKIREQQLNDMQQLWDRYCGNIRPSDPDIPLDTPLFRGGNIALQQLIQEMLIYPKAAREQCIHGTVLMKFRVNKDGAVDSAHIIHSVDSLLDAAALKLAKRLSYFWFPALDNGQPVDDFVLLPVRFNNKDIRCHDDKWYYGEGVRLYEENKLESALTHFERAWQINYLNYDALYNMAAVKMTLGQKDDACAHIRHLKEAGYTDAATLGKQYCE